MLNVSLMPQFLARRHGTVDESNFCPWHALRVGDLPF
jgi:hypothetical protein